jgi:hypothetical protein
MTIEISCTLPPYPDPLVSPALGLSLSTDGPLNFTLAAITYSPTPEYYEGSVNPTYDLLQSISHDVVGYLTQHRPHHITIDDKDAPIAVQIQP